VHHPAGTDVLLAFAVLFSPDRRDDRRRMSGGPVWSAKTDPV